MPRASAPEGGPVIRLARGQPLLVAFVVAALITAGLGAVVLAPLLTEPPVERGVPVAGAALDPSPPTAPSERPAATATVQPTATATAARRREPTPRPTPTATQQPPARAGMPRPPEDEDATLAAAPAAAPVLLYQAEADSGLGAWQATHWRFDGEALVNDGRGVSTEPWLSAPAVEVNGSYAIEAEFQVLGVASGYCEQSFGVIAVAMSGRNYLGGGFFYGCDADRALIRITDVTDWSDGYNRDPELASAPLDPDEGWHTLRLEIAPGHVRLLIDGEVVLEADDPAAAAGARSVEVGLWSQGVQVAVRRISVVSLPAEA